MASCLRNHTKIIIAKFRKRYRQNGWHLFTHLCKNWVAANSNDMEHINRTFVLVRNNSSGNQTQKGMGANPILFTIRVTYWINGNNLLAFGSRNE